MPIVRNRRRRRKVSNNEAEDEDEDKDEDEDEDKPEGRNAHDVGGTMADVRRTGALVQMQKRAEHVKSISSK